MTSERPTRAEISLAALKSNLSLARQLAHPARIMAVVKAEAYGHGLIPVAKEFSHLGVDYLAVSFLEEGVRLREIGIDIPILVMGGLVDEQIGRYLDYNLEITVSSIWKGRQVEQIAVDRHVKAAVHLKIDTGMGRIGQNWQTAELFLQEISRFKHLDVRGLYTHFATADEEDLTFTHTQLQRFNEVIDTAHRIGLNPPYIHAANSGAMMQLIDESRFTMVRPGIMLYGWAPSRYLQDRFPLMPVMTLKSHVVYVKYPPAGTTIGYGASWRSPGGRWIATLPIGYGDGYPRRAGNRAWMKLRGRHCPVIGRISMDQITIDAGYEVYLGDEAVLFGGKGDNYLSLWDFSDVLETIPYEILCGLTSRVPRVYLRDENSEKCAIL